MNRTLLCLSLSSNLIGDVGAEKLAEVCEIVHGLFKTKNCIKCCAKGLFLLMIAEISLPIDIAINFLMLTGENCIFRSFQNFH